MQHVQKWARSWAGEVSAGTGVWLPSLALSLTPVSPSCSVLSLKVSRWAKASPAEMCSLALEMQRTETSAVPICVWSLPMVFYPGCQRAWLKTVSFLPGSVCLDSAEAGASFIFKEYTCSIYK